MKFRMEPYDIIIGSQLEGRIGSKILKVFDKDSKINHIEILRYILKAGKKDAVYSGFSSIGDVIDHGSPDMTDLHMIVDNDEKWMGNFSIKRSGMFLELAVTIYCFRVDLKEITEKIEGAIENLKADISGMTQCRIDWFYLCKGEIESARVTEMISETVHQEAYPTVPNVDQFIDDYFTSDSSIMILIGPAGSGKSRLIRYIMTRFSKKMDEDPHVLFSTDMNVIKTGDSFFLGFRTGNFDFMVLEDVDDLLSSRDKGNDSIHKFLSASDGFLSVDGRNKIILSTNLPISKIDDALIRPGRCYAHVEFRTLDKDEARKLAIAIIGDDKIAEQITERKYSVGEVYHLTKGYNMKHHPGNRPMGFNKLGGS